LKRNGDDGNTIAVLNGRTCNARDTSGCGQLPAAIVTVPGVFFNQEFGTLAVLALDPSNHTLYAGDANDGPVSMVNTATCNAMNTSGCTQTPSTMANGDGIAMPMQKSGTRVTRRKNLFLSRLPYFTKIHQPHFVHIQVILVTKEQGSRLPDPCHRSLPGSPAATLGDGQRQVFGCRYPAAVASHRAF